MYYILATMMWLIATPMAQTTGADRCAVRDCLCRVYPGTPSAPASVPSPYQRRMSLYFSEDSSELDEGQAGKLRAFARSLGEKNLKNVTVIGYTDGCGSSSHNRSLSSARTREVSAVVRSRLPTARISPKAAGENSVGHTAEARRVDVIFHIDRRLTTAIEKIPADVYLIDASGSMWDGWRDWQDIINASVKPGSKIYLSIMTGCYNGQKITSVSPQSGTEIWYSYWKVLDYMSRGQTLAIISDFNANVPLTSRESDIIRRKAQEKGIEVVMIR